MNIIHKILKQNTCRNYVNKNVPMFNAIKNSLFDKSDITLKHLHQNNTWSLFIFNQIRLSVSQNALLYRSAYSSIFFIQLPINVIFLHI